MVMECKGREMTGKIGEKGSIEKKRASFTAGNFNYHYTFKCFSNVLYS